MYLIRAARPDLVIPMTAGGDLPAKGIVLGAVDLYWRRREAEADVTIDDVTADEIDAAIAEATAARAATTSTKATRASTTDTAEQKG